MKVGGCPASSGDYGASGNGVGYRWSRSIPMRTCCVPLTVSALVRSCSCLRFRSSAQPARPAPAHFEKLAHTYSIVAWDSVTGDLGVAVQSKFPNVGGIVPWAEAGVGAVATQSLANTAYGERGLQLMAQGAVAGEALRIVMRSDTSWRPPGRDGGRARQRGQLHGGAHLRLGRRAGRRGAGGGSGARDRSLPGGVSPHRPTSWSPTRPSGTWPRASSGPRAR